MRRTFFAISHWLAVSCFLLESHLLAVATIEGRVIDCAGEPADLEHSPR